MTQVTNYAPCSIKVGKTEMLVECISSKTNGGIYLRMENEERKGIYCLKHTKTADRKSADEWSRKIRIHSRKLADLWSSKDLASFFVHLKLIS